MTDKPSKARRGFAAMSAETKREMSARGGRAAHARGTAHEYTSEEAAAAGRLGGLKVSKDREHMAAIGRKGGMIRLQRRLRAAAAAEADAATP